MVAAPRPRPLRRARIERLPKADLHLHLEGSITLADLRALYPAARRPPVPRREWPALYRFRGFPGFLRAFGSVCSLLAAPDDFGRAALRLAGRLRPQGVRRAEVFVSLPVHLRRGLRGEAILDSLEHAREAARRGGVQMAWILDGVRQWGAESLAPCVDLARRYRARGVLGIGLGGDETARPPEEFRALFHEARESGLRTVLHAGETGGPADVQRAIEVLAPERLGHALRAAEDPRLIDRIAARGIPVEVAVTSNWRTGLLKRRTDHPLRRLLEAGVRVVLAADDPAFFRTTLVGEYAQAQRLFRLTPRQIHGLARESMAAAFDQ